MSDKGSGLESIASSIKALACSVLALAHAVEVLPLRERAYSGLTPEEAEERLKQSVSRVKEAFKEIR